MPNGAVAVVNLSTAHFACSVDPNKHIRPSRWSRLHIFFSFASRKSSKALAINPSMTELDKNGEVSHLHLTSLVVLDEIGSSPYYLTQNIVDHSDGSIYLLEWSEFGLISQRSEVT